MKSPAKESLVTFFCDEAFNHKQQGWDGLVQTGDPWGGASFDPMVIHMNKIDKGL